MIKDIFGKPQNGIHSLRFFGIAFWDLFLTVIASIIIGKIYKTNILKVFIILFMLGTILHSGFGVETAFIKLIRL